MASTEMPMLASHSCVSCKHGKRKCDKLKPSCSACTRIHRTCMYQDTPAAGASTTTPADVGFPHSTAYHPETAGPSLGSLSGLAGHTNLQRPEVNLSVRNESLKIFGSMQGLHTTVGIYFNSVHQRVTIVSKKRFLERLAGFSVSAPADLAALCLAMNLIIQQPHSNPGGMQSPLYAHLKSIISLLEASNYQSLEVVQCRLLCTFYELGHGIHPAVSVSLGACARISRFVGLEMRANPDIEVHSNSIILEEWRRVWWTLANLDRFVSLSFGDHLLCTQDARMDELLPIEDKLWLQDVLPPPTTSGATLGTSYDNRVGQLARECQVSHLAGRVVRHVFDPAPDPSFQAREAAQLETTLMAMMPVLSSEEINYGRYCSSLGICSSALYLLYDYPAQTTRGETSGQQSLRAMEPLSTQIVGFSRQLFGGTEEDRDYSTFAPYVPLSIYQSAVVQLRLWRQTSDPTYENGLNSLKGILGYFVQRWTIAGIYLSALEQDEPVLLPHSISSQRL